MNDLYTWPENDYRYYLSHAYSHKYLDKIKLPNGKWRYVYDYNKAGKQIGDSLKKGVQWLQNAWDRSSLSSKGKKRRENANKVYQNMLTEDRRRSDNATSEIIEAKHRNDESAFDKAIKKRNASWGSLDASRKKRNNKTKKYLDFKPDIYYEERYKEEDRKKKQKARYG